MTVLILGGTGSTGLKLAHLLRDASIPVLITSRSGVAPDGFPAVKLDWSDSTTFSAPFEKHQIDKIYFIGPHERDMLSVAKPFIDLGLDKGVKQWVLVGGSSAQKGGQGMGAVYAYVQEKGVDCAMLKPTWFSDNFATQFVHSIKAKNEFISATGTARIPFVASSDIAQAAFDILTSSSKELKNAEPYIVGPELLSNDEAATILSDVVGRTIAHRNLIPDEYTKRLVGVGMPQSVAEFLTWLNVRTAGGAEETVFAAEDRKEIKYVGKKTLREFFEENKDVWTAA